ncbi:hypothetical protein [Actinoallomurus sp. NPDC052274]|uniref:hypothetical protein n=1 Tax=Actinoallomurus sp. NPDC052274 TaxID=3155420 RepID=UPI00341F920B
MMRRRVRIVLSATLLIATGGCATSSHGDTSPSVSSTALVGSTSSPFPVFRPGEIRSVPDPRTLFSPALRKELRFDAYHGSECKKDKANEYIDGWACYLFTPRKRLQDTELLAVYVEVHHPTPTQDATEFTTRDFASYRQVLGSEWAPAQLGDEALRAETAGASWIRLRIRNVMMAVSADIPDPDPRSVSEEDRRAWRAATELTRSITGLAQ